jgi:hypothetical protein
VKPGALERIKTLAAAALPLAAIAVLFAPLAMGERIVAERDALSAVLPAKLLLARSLQALALPWWNPAPALGKPFYSDPLPGVLSPWNALLALEPFARAYGAFLAAQYAWTALGAFLCLRASALVRTAAVVGALVWALGGAMLSLANVANHLAAVAWVPWVLLGWSRPRATAARVAWASLAMAPVFLAGSPEMAALAAAALVLWSWDPRSLAVPLLAAGLAAVEVIPIAAFTAESYRGARPFGVAAAMRLAATGEQLVQLVRDTGAVAPPTFLATVYVGPIAVALAAVALAALPWRRALVVAVTAALVVLVALGPATPVFAALYQTIPLASLVRYPGKALVALHAMIAFGAAFGLARLAERMRGRGAALALAAVAAAAVLPLLLAFGGALRTEPADEVLSPPPIARAMLADAAAAGDVGDAVGAQPVRYFSNTAGTPQAGSPGEAIALDRALLLAATGELYGLANVNTPSSLNLIPHEILQRALGAASLDRALGALAALGTRYATTWVPFDGSAVAREVPVPPARGDLAVRLYRLEGASPRAFVATRIAVAGDAVGAVGRFALSHPGNHAGLAVLEAGDAAAAARARIGFDTEGERLPENAHAIRWREAAPSRLALDVELASPGLLVVNDTWAPGWSAEVDGALVPILRVNGLVRGVVLDAGRHAVAMRYRPPGLREGCLLSLASGLGVVMLLMAARRARATAAPRR